VLQTLEILKVVSTDIKNLEVLAVVKAMRCGEVAADEKSLDFIVIND
jgi:hypothetical protein